MPATEVNQLPVKRQLTLRYSRAATIMVVRYRDTDGTYLPIEVQAALATDWLDEGGTNVLDCTVTAVSNEGQEVTIAAADWATAAVPFTDLKCEEVRAHPNQENVWILYCDKSGPGAPSSDWALVDAAVRYSGSNATATSSAMFESAGYVVTYKQTCKWVSRNNNWTVSSCTAPLRTSSFPLG